MLPGLSPVLLSQLSLREPHQRRFFLSGWFVWRRRLGGRWSRGPRRPWRSRLVVEVLKQGWGRRHWVTGCIPTRCLVIIFINVCVLSF